MQISAKEIIAIAVLVGVILAGSNLMQLKLNCVWDGSGSTNARIEFMQIEQSK